MKRNKLIAFLLMMLMLLVALSGCTKATEQIESDENAAKLQNEDSSSLESTYPMTVVDSHGREVVIEKEPVRVISVAPSITETIFAVGAGGKLVGRTDWCEYPAQTANVTSVGRLSEPNIETIASLKPDLIIASTHFKQESLAKLEELGFKVIVLIEQEGFEGVYSTIGKVGEILNRQQEADAVVEDMQSVVSQVADKVKDAQPVSVYYVVAYGEYGDYTATGDTFISDMIEMAGGRNVAKDATGWAYSLEKIVENDPEIIICSKHNDTKAGIENANGYMNLNAVKNGKLLEIDDDMIDVQGPRTANGLKALAKLIHPELFK